jgi:hypothetical protein
MTACTAIQPSSAERRQHLRQGLRRRWLADEDLFAGQVKFSDTFSRIEGNSLVYGTITWDTTSGATKLTVGSLAGFNFWQETQVGFGARCNRDDVDGAVCGPPGFIEVPFSTKVIRNQPNWASLRLGAELRVRLWDRLSLIADAAALPVAYVWNEDSHYLRKDIGTVPNIVDRGDRLGLPARGRSPLCPHTKLEARRRRALLVRRRRRQYRVRSFQH